MDDQIQIARRRPWLSTVVSLFFIATYGLYFTWSGLSSASHTAGSKPVAAYEICALVFLLDAALVSFYWLAALGEKTGHLHEDFPQRQFGVAHYMLGLSSLVGIPIGMIGLGVRFPHP